MRVTRAGYLCGTNRLTEEGRTHMLHNHNRWGVVPGLLVVAFLAACSQDGLSPDRSRLGPPSKKVTGGGCPVKKFTGGGRIDPTSPNANADLPNGASGF